MKLTSEPAAAQLIRLLLGLAIQKVDVALEKVDMGEKKMGCLQNFIQTNEIPGAVK